MKQINTIIMALITLCINVNAQDMPVINPKAVFFNNGAEEESVNISASAPLRAVFTANPEFADGWDATYEWRFYMEGEQDRPYVVRYEQDTEYTFIKAGAHNVVLFAKFTRGDEIVEYNQEYWDEVGPIRVNISESKLEMPNAFSPNGDGFNDIFKAKDGYQSIVSFHAYIFNRWGQKLFDWTDPADGWDGKYKGKDVAEGVYFVLVEAKGADGRKFNIKRDVNLLRGYKEGVNGGGGVAQ